MTGDAIRKGPAGNSRWTSDYPAVLEEASSDQETCLHSSRNA